MLNVPVDTLLQQSIRVDIIASVSMGSMGSSEPNNHERGPFCNHNYQSLKIFKNSTRFKLMLFYEMDAI